MNEAVPDIPDTQPQPVEKNPTEQFAELGLEPGDTLEDFKGKTAEITGIEWDKDLPGGGQMILKVTELNGQQRSKIVSFEEVMKKKDTIKVEKLHKQDEEPDSLEAMHSAIEAKEDEIREVQDGRDILDNLLNRLMLLKANEQEYQEKTEKVNRKRIMETMQTLNAEIQENFKGWIIEKPILREIFETEELERILHDEAFNDPTRVTLEDINDPEQFFRALLILLEDSGTERLQELQELQEIYNQYYKP